MRISYTYIVGAILLSTLFSCGHKNDDGHDHEAAEVKETKADAHGADEIILDPEAAEHFGVRSEVITPSPFNDVITVSGEITSAPEDMAYIAAKSSGIVNLAPGMVVGKQVSAGARIASISAKGIAGGDANAAAAADVAAAKKEVDRLRPLYEERIITQKEYNAAVATYDKARAMYSGSASGSVATSPISGVITAINAGQGAFVNTGDIIATVSHDMRLTLRADLPQKYARQLADISTANFRISYSDSIMSLADLNGKRISSASVAVNPGYIPVYFSFDNNGAVLPGSYAEVYLIGARKENVLVVPVASVVEQQGRHFVYVKIDDHGYEKRPVVLGRNNGTDVEILSGLHSGDCVVVKGSIFVKLAETSNVVPEGHSHNH